MKLHIFLHYTLQIIMEPFPFQLCVRNMSTLDQCFPPELSVMMGVPYRGHQPAVATEHLARGFSSWETKSLISSHFN